MKFALLYINALPLPLLLQGVMWNSRCTNEIKRFVILIFWRRLKSRPKESQLDLVDVRSNPFCCCWCCCCTDLWLHLVTSCVCLPLVAMILHCLATQRKLTQVNFSTVFTSRSARAWLHWNGSIETVASQSCHLSQVCVQVCLLNSAFPILRWLMFPFGQGLTHGVTSEISVFVPWSVVHRQWCIIKSIVCNIHKTSVNISDTLVR